MIKEFEKWYRDVEDWDFYVLDLGIPESTLVLGQWKMGANYGTDLFFAYECGDEWLLSLQEEFAGQAKMADLDELAPILEAALRLSEALKRSAREQQ